MFRRALAVVVGFVVFLALVFACELLGSRLFPISAVDPNDEAALRAAMQKLPAGALWLVLAGWVVASFVGAFIAAKIAQSRRPALILGVAATLVGIVNDLGVPPPLWFWALTLVAFVPPAWAAARLAVR